MTKNHKKYKTYFLSFVIIRLPQLTWGLLKQPYPATPCSHGLKPCPIYFTVPTELKNMFVLAVQFVPRALPWAIVLRPFRTKKTAIVLAVSTSFPGLTPCATIFTVPTELKNMFVLAVHFGPRALPWAIVLRPFRTEKTTIVLAVNFVLRTSHFLLQNDCYFGHAAGFRSAV